MFTSSEYFDMLVLYGQCDESATIAAQEYAVRFLKSNPCSGSVHSGSFAALTISGGVHENASSTVSLPSTGF
jgi:hypothetical protein